MRPREYTLADMWFINRATVHIESEYAKLYEECETCVD